MIRLLLFGGDIGLHLNPGSHRYACHWARDICLKPNTKHLSYIT